MSAKERWLAAILLRPVDRLPFWPKLDGAYFRAQAAPFKRMDSRELHDWIGSDNHEWFADVVKEIRHATSVEISQAGETRRTIYHTRFGTTELIQQFDVPSQSWYPVKHPIQSVDDIKLMTEVFADCLCELDHEKLEQAKSNVNRIGNKAVTSGSVGTSPLMLWVRDLAGVEEGHYLLADDRQEVEALFDAIHQVTLSKTKIMVEHAPYDLLFCVEDTSTTLISPQQFGKYCKGQLGEYGRIAQASGRLFVLHMCGHLKALLPDLAALPVHAFEAFSSPPVGNTTLLDGRSVCVDKCLIGGTNADLWTRNANEIIEQIERDLDGLPHHRGIILTSGGVTPPTCKPETIKTVCDWVRSYSARI